MRKSKEKSTSISPARTGNDALPSGSSEWMGGKWLGTLKMTHQGISPSSPTYSPQKNTTTKMMTTPQEPFWCGSYPPWWEAGPPSQCSAMHLTSSPATIGVLWPKSTGTMPWTSSASRWPPKLISSNRRYKWPGWNRVSARDDSKQHGWIVKSAICNWVRQGPDTNKTELGWTWCARTTKLAMDMGIHSDRGGGVTGLGYHGHCI